MSATTKKKKAKVDRVEDTIVQKIEQIKAKKNKSGPVVVSESKSTKANKASLKTKKKAKGGHKKVQISSAETDHNGDVDSDSDVKGAKPSAKLMLNDVIDLGGTQDDYDLLQNVSDNEVELEIDSDIDPNFNVGELITFMKSNGFKTLKKVKDKPVSKSVVVNDTKPIPQTCPIAPHSPPQHDQLIFKANEPW